MLKDRAPTRFPLLQGYLDGLPDGLHSYPECRAKASLVRFVTARCPEGEFTALPPPLAELVRSPPPATGWVPEVQYNALSLAVADLLGRDASGFGALWYAVMDEMVQSPLYRVVLGLVSPTALLKTAAKRWGMFHVGTRLTATTSPDGLSLSIRHPAHLLDSVLAAGYVRVFEVLVAHSRQPKAQVRLEGHDAETTRLSMIGFQEP